MFSLDSAIRDALGSRTANHLLRQRKTVRVLDAVHLELAGRRCVNFASNNYLGLTHHPELIAASQLAIESHGTGAGAAALVTGQTDLHDSAGRAIAAWKGTESAVPLPSGWQANYAAIGALAGVFGNKQGGVRFLLDKLVHASIIDAVRATGAPMRVFGHNGMDKLRRLLAEVPAEQTQVVVTESIFSMDGDAADLRALAALRAQYRFILVLDEAHASGVYGVAGSGFDAELGLRDAVDVTVVTLSKALGGSGGAVCGSAAVADAVVNFGRAMIYTTNIAPSAAATAKAAIQVLAAEPWRQQRVRKLAQYVRGELSGLAMQGEPSCPIIPIVLKDEAAASYAAETLLQGGLLVVPIRPPTVARGTSRLRLTVSAAHTDAEVDAMIAQVRRVVNK